MFIYPNKDEKYYRKVQFFKKYLQVLMGLYSKNGSAEIGLKNQTNSKYVFELVNNQKRKYTLMLICLTPGHEIQNRN